MHVALPPLGENSERGLEFPGPSSPTATFKFHTWSSASGIILNTFNLFLIQSNPRQDTFKGLQNISLWFVIKALRLPVYLWTGTWVSGMVLGGPPTPQHPWWWLRRAWMWGVSWPRHASSSRLRSSGNTPPRLPSPCPLVCCSQPAGCGGHLPSPAPHSAESGTWNRSLTFTPCSCNGFVSKAHCPQQNNSRDAASEGNWGDGWMGLALRG